MGRGDGRGTEAEGGAAMTGSGSSGGGKAPKGESDVQKKMREALEAKQARSKSAQGEDHKGGHGVGPAHNDKTQRQFRRKSGG
jgi:hypothetical protein